jgi:hypothetical protein
MAQFDERAFWLAMRQALLMMVDAIEQRLQMPRTSEIRKQNKEEVIPLDSIRYTVFVNLVKSNSQIKDYKQLSYRDCEVLIREIAVDYSRLKSLKTQTVYTDADYAGTWNKAE